MPHLKRVTASYILLINIISEEKKNLNLGVKFPDLKMLATNSILKKMTCEPNTFHLLPVL